MVQVKGQVQVINQQFNFDVLVNIVFVDCIQELFDVNVVEVIVWLLGIGIDCSGGEG